MNLTVFAMDQCTIAEIKRVTTVADLRECLSNAVGRLGYAAFCIVQVDAVSGIDEHAILSNYRHRRIEQILAAGDYRNDPVVRRAIKSIEPFEWTELSGLDHQQAVYMQDARAVGIRDGFSVPLHLPGLVTGIFSFVNRTDAYDPETSKPSAAFVAAYGFERLRRLTRGPVRAARLSEFQQECLVFIARGKTVATAAALLRRKRHEVETALREAQKVYRTRGRVDTVIRALVERDITLEGVNG